MISLLVPMHSTIGRIIPVLTDTPITTICQSVDRLANGALFTVRSTGTLIVHRLSLDQPVHQSIATSFIRTTNIQYANIPDP